MRNSNVNWKKRQIMVKKRWAEQLKKNMKRKMGFVRDIEDENWVS
jgi:hypothetical protein